LALNIEFIFPLRQLHWWLGLAIAVLALLIVGLRALEKRRQARLAEFVDAGLAPRLLPGYDPTMRRPLFWLTVAGFASLALTFAQPHWGQTWQAIRQQSHDLILCLDTSESMRAANPLPTRLDRAKQKVLSILDRTPGDRFGLVAFAGAAALQCPLTHDQGYFKAVLNAVDTDTISMEGTDIGSAIREAVKAFQEESARTGVMDNNSRAIILISDGEQVTGDAVAEAEKASEYARVNVIGVGDPNGTEITLPDWMGNYVSGRDRSKSHLSKLDEETLSKIAIAGKGGYIRSTPDTSDIDQIYDYIQRLTTYSASSDVRLRLVNRYQWPLTLAILCFAGEGLWIALMPWVRGRRIRKGRPGLEAALWNVPEKTHG
jgi:Ca-activated chloride channel family protein